MKLRFLKGSWGFGNFKLQFLHEDGYWEDVPIETFVNELPVEKKPLWKKFQQDLGIERSDAMRLVAIATKHFEES